jgi:hypothetical protein
MRQFYHLIQTVLPAGQSKVILTLCNFRSVEILKEGLQKAAEIQNAPIVYSIDPTQVREPNRQCDECACQGKG